MRVRGFPTADFEQRAADLSEDHPRLVESYHAAHDLARWCRVYDELVEAPAVELAAAR